MGYLIWNCPKTCLWSKEHTVPSGSRERGHMFLIFPTMSRTTRFHTILRILNTGEQKLSLSWHGATLMEAETIVVLVKEKVTCGLEKVGAS